jgi:hypothetical protein
MSWAANDEDSNPFASDKTSETAAPAAPAQKIAAAPPPSWLSNTTPSQAQLGSSNDFAIAPPPAAAAAAAAPQENASVISNPAPRASSHGQPPPQIVYLRMINLIVSMAVIACAILSLIALNGSPSKAILAIYVIFFAIMICCFELQVRMAHA